MDTHAYAVKPFLNFFGVVDRMIVLEHGILRLIEGRQNVIFQDPFKAYPPVTSAPHAFALYEVWTNKILQLSYGCM